MGCAASRQNPAPDAHGADLFTVQRARKSIVATGEKRQGTGFAIKAADTSGNIENNIRSDQKKRSRRNSRVSVRSIGSNISQAEVDELLNSLEAGGAVPQSIMLRRDSESRTLLTGEVSADVEASTSLPFDRSSMCEDEHNNEVNVSHPQKVHNNSIALSVATTECPQSIAGQAMNDNGFEPIALQQRYSAFMSFADADGETIKADCVANGQVAQSKSICLGGAAESVCGGQESLQGKDLNNSGEEESDDDQPATVSIGTTKPRRGVKGFNGKPPPTATSSATPKQKRNKSVHLSVAGSEAAPSINGALTDSPTDPSADAIAARKQSMRMSVAGSERAASINGELTEEGFEPTANQQRQSVRMSAADSSAFGSISGNHLEEAICDPDSQTRGTVAQKKSVCLGSVAESELDQGLEGKDFNNSEEEDSDDDKPATVSIGTSKPRRGVKGFNGKAPPTATSSATPKKKRNKSVHLSVAGSEVISSISGALTDSPTDNSEDAIAARKQSMRMSVAGSERAPSINGELTEEGYEPTTNQQRQSVRMSVAATECTSISGVQQFQSEEEQQPQALSGAVARNKSVMLSVADSEAAPTHSAELHEEQSNDKDTTVRRNKSLHLSTADSEYTGLNAELTDDGFEPNSVSNVEANKNEAVVLKRSALLGSLADSEYEPSIHGRELQESTTTIPSKEVVAKKKSIRMSTDSSQYDPSIHHDELQEGSFDQVDANIRKDASVHVTRLGAKRASSCSGVDGVLTQKEGENVSATSMDRASSRKQSVSLSNTNDKSYCSIENVKIKPLDVISVQSSETRRSSNMSLRSGGASSNKIPSHSKGREDSLQQHERQCDTLSNGPTIGGEDSTDRSSTPDVRDLDPSMGGAEVDSLGGTMIRHRMTPPAEEEFKAMSPLEAVEEIKSTTDASRLASQRNSTHTAPTSHADNKYEYHQSKPLAIVPGQQKIACAPPPRNGDPDSVSVYVQVHVPLVRSGSPQSQQLTPMPPPQRHSTTKHVPPHPPLTHQRPLPRNPYSLNRRSNSKERPQRYPPPDQLATVAKEKANEVKPSEAHRPSPPHGRPSKSKSKGAVAKPLKPLVKNISPYAWRPPHPPRRPPSKKPAQFPRPGAYVLAGKRPQHARHNNTRAIYSSPRNPNSSKKTTSCDKTKPRRYCARPFSDWSFQRFAPYMSPKRPPPTKRRISPRSAPQHDDDRNPQDALPDLVFAPHSVSQPSVIAQQNIKKERDRPQLPCAPPSRKAVGCTRPKTGDDLIDVIQDDDLDRILGLHGFWGEVSSHYYNKHSGKR